MLLDDWISATGRTYTSLAGELGAHDRRTVHRWAKGERLPGPDDVAKVQQLSEGVVTYDDHVAAIRRRRQAAKAAA